MNNVSILDVLLHGEPVGTLTRFAGDRTLFAFNDNYLDNSERPVLSLGFKDRFGGLIKDFRPTRTRVMPFFSNLLPEGRLRAYLAERAGVNSAREFYLLWALGLDMPGAIVIRSADGDSWPPDTSDGADTNTEDQGRGEDLLRFSLAGVQLKFSAVLEARGGAHDPCKGRRRVMDCQAAVARICRGPRKRIRDDDPCPAHRHRGAGIPSRQHG